MHGNFPPEPATPTQLEKRSVVTGAFNRQARDCMRLQRHRPQTWACNVTSGLTYLRCSGGGGAAAGAPDTHDPRHWRGRLSHEGRCKTGAEQPAAAPCKRRVASPQVKAEAETFLTLRCPIFVSARHTRQTACSFDMNMIRAWVAGTSGTWRSGPGRQGNSVDSAAAATCRQQGTRESRRPTASGWLCIRGWSMRL